MKEVEENTTVATEFETINEHIIDAITDIKGKNIVQLDLRKLDDASAEYYIICEGESTTQVRAIAANIKKRLKDEAGVYTVHTEGEAEAKWVLIDYFDVVVHVFYPETRAFYDIEDLWSDAAVTEYENL